MLPEKISIGIICPLPIEVAAMIQMLDERYSTQQFPRDPNLYHFGRIGEHNIVIAGLPDGLTGIASATTVAERLFMGYVLLRESCTVSRYRWRCAYNQKRHATWRCGSQSP